MGCDVHADIQVKGYNGWECRIKPDCNRNYTFFGTLAGVRDSWGIHLPICAPRGMPKDLGNDYFPGNWLHTFSWFTLAEAKKYYSHKYTPGKDKPIEEIYLWRRWRSWIKDMEYCKKYIPNVPKDLLDDNIRVVFCFDS